MIEVEIKIKIKDANLVGKNLQKLGFSTGDFVKESDLYFDKQDHQIKNSDSALRIRSSENITLNQNTYFLTYKGPKLDQISNTRKEIEVQIEDAQKGKEILISLGYSLVSPVIKTRQHYHFGEITACLDQVENLGTFLEMEVIVSSESERESAVKRLFSLLQKLGYQTEEIVRTSYLSMLLSQRERFEQALDQVEAEVEKLLAEKEQVIIAIDGRCASGKTTFTKALQQKLACDAVHMDDFFLRPEQRTPERRQTPGENVDHERFLEEVLLPYKAGAAFSYKPFDCSTQQLQAPVDIVPGKLLIVEGAYSCHKSLYEHYDLHIFMDVDPDVQMERILARNGAEQAKRFEEMWIPLEERYLEAFDVKARCEMELKW
jgi:predicted adenylyl cyclase CyaB